MRWTAVGAQKPTTGTEIENQALATALQQKEEFTQEEWDAFAITGLSHDTYIKVGDTYFIPAARAAAVAGPGTGAATGDSRHAIVNGPVLKAKTPTLATILTPSAKTKPDLKSSSVSNATAPVAEPEKSQTTKKVAKTAERTSEIDKLAKLQSRQPTEHKQLHPRASPVNPLVSWAFSSDVKKLLPCFRQNYWVSIIAGLMILAVIYYSGMDGRTAVKEHDHPEKAASQQQVSDQGRWIRYFHAQDFNLRFGSWFPGSQTAPEAEREKGLQCPHSDMQKELKEAAAERAKEIARLKQELETVQETSRKREVDMLQQSTTSQKIIQRQIERLQRQDEEIMALKRGQEGVNRPAMEEKPGPDADSTDTISVDGWLPAVGAAVGAAVSTAVCHGIFWFLTQ